MALTAAQMLAVIAPQFASHADVPTHIAMAEMITSPANAQGWSAEQRERAVALRAAHSLTLALDPSFAGGGGGGVQMKREGDLQITYRTTSAKVFDKYPGLAQTSYGSELIDLINGTWVAAGCSSGIEDLGSYEG